MTIDVVTGRNKDIDDEIYRLYSVIHDIQELDKVQTTAQDPELIKISAEEIIELATEFKDLCSNIEKNITEWINKCKEDDIPVYLGYYRVLRDLEER